VVVSDNVIIHRSKLASDGWPPTHAWWCCTAHATAPTTTQTERIWFVLKAWLANSPTLTIQGRLRQVHAFFRERTMAQMLATAALLILAARRLHAEPRATWR
jgi:hypothetical protein